MASGAPNWQILVMIVDRSRGEGWNWHRCSLSTLQSQIVAAVVPWSLRATTGVTKYESTCSYSGRGSSKAPVAQHPTAAPERGHQRHSRLHLSTAVSLPSHSHNTRGATTRSVRATTSHTDSCSTAQVGPSRSASLFGRRPPAGLGCSTKSGHRGLKLIPGPSMAGTRAGKRSDPYRVPATLQHGHRATPYARTCDLCKRRMLQRLTIFRTPLVFEALRVAGRSYAKAVRIASRCGSSLAIPSYDGTSVI